MLSRRGESRLADTLIITVAVAVVVADYLAYQTQTRTPATVVTVAQVTGKRRIGAGTCP